MLPVLKSGVFVEPLPDQIAVVYEYQQVQVYSYKAVMAGNARDFVLNPMDFRTLSDSGDVESNQLLCDSQYIHETTPGLFSDASTSVPRAHIRRELVRPSVHPKWPAFAASVAEENQCCVVLER